MQIITLPKTDRNLLSLLLLNVVLLIMHIQHNYENVFYFFQLTIVGQIIVILNFFLSIVLNEKKSGTNVRRFLSRLHLMGLGLETVVVVGFWGLRIFFSKGIIDQNQKRNYYTEFLSVWVHGGSLITLCYFIKADQIVMEQRKRIKFVIHGFWGIPFILLQVTHFKACGKHIYGFIQFFTWEQIIIFELILFLIAVGIDYLLTIRHGLILTIKHMKSTSNSIKSISDLEKQKQINDRREYEEEEKAVKQEENLSKIKKPKSL